MSKLFGFSLLVCGFAVLTSGHAELEAKTCKSPPVSPAEREAVDAGRKAFIACASCHDLGSTRSAKIGPALGTMFDGKPLAAQYNYSKAFEGAAPNWRNTKKFDAFLAKPSAAVPGTKMVFAGIAKAEDRKNLIAFLKSETGKPSCK